MFHLKNTSMATNAATNVETETPTKLDFENYSSLPFSDRRIADRRIFSRRSIETSNIKKITILIPCYNEEKGIGKVIDGVPIKTIKQKLLSSITIQATILSKLLRRKVPR